MSSQHLTVYVEGRGVGLIPISPQAKTDAYARLSPDERQTVDAYAAEIALHLNAIGLPRPKW